MAPVIWLTGLSGAGKSTLAQEIARILRGGQNRVEVLDGDVIRASLWPDLGFSREDRETNIRRLSTIARLLSQHGVVVVVSAITPYRALRDQLRREHEVFIEVFANAPLEVCMHRDPKGLYARVREGAIQNFTGVSDAYEPPLCPEVECRTDTETIAESSAKVIDFLRSQGLCQLT